MVHQEALLPGHLLQVFLKERLQDWQQRLRETITKEQQDKPGSDFGDALLVTRCINRACQLAAVGTRTEYLLSTGNLVSKSGMGMSQTSGFTVVAEKLNYLRYLSHFRSVHRGAYFQELRTTTVRKLLPDSWGFMCPVHTPDGSPCGLLNHLASACQIVTAASSATGEVPQAVCSALCAAGMIPSSPALTVPPPPLYLPVLLDGRVVGSLSSSGAVQLVLALRRLKVKNPNKIDFEILTTIPENQVNSTNAFPQDLEVAHVPVSDGGAYPGVYLFTSPARFLRPVRQLFSGAASTLELVGTLEQAYMDIRCPDGGESGSRELPATHEETSPAAFLSAVASMTPWSDFNQSPRNMYQCQMAKQTMGTPMSSYVYRSDTKLYRLHTPQKPVACTQGYDKYHVNDFPLGTNAVVAVLSYTGCV